MVREASSGTALCLKRIKILKNMTDFQLLIEASITRCRQLREGVDLPGIQV